MADVVTLAGSPSHPSRSTAILDHVRAQFEANGFSTESVQVRDLPAEALLFAQFDNPAIQQAIAAVANARIVVIATPVYKAAYTGVLKALLDVLPQRAFSNKSVFPIATGGSPAHLLSIDYALKPVLSALGAEHILGGLYIQDSQIQYGNGAVQLEVGVETRLQDAILTLTTVLRQPEFVSINA
jgi:FMN reductase